MRFFFVSVFLGVIFLPTFALAQSSGFVTCDGVIQECTACHLVTTLQKVLNFLVTASVFVGVLMFSWAGILMVVAAGDTGKIEKAKGIFTAVAIGFIIVLSGWLIVDTLMKVFFQPGDGGGQGSELYEATQQEFGPWNEIKCTGDTSNLTNAQNQRGGLDVIKRDGVTTEGTLSHDEALARLESNPNIRVTSTAGRSGVRDGCTGAGCTSLAGVRSDTIDQVLELQKACDCPVRPVGFTEGGAGHSCGSNFSHCSGHKVDVDDNNQSFNNFIQTNYTPSGVRGGANGGQIYKDPCGNEYVQERTHWDITVRSVCSI